MIPRVRAKLKFWFRAEEASGSKVQEPQLYPVGYAEEQQQRPHAPLLAAEQASWVYEFYFKQQEYAANIWDLIYCNLDQTKQVTQSNLKALK